MANSIHLAILRRGFGVWNEWRHTNISVRPDLSGIDVTKEDLKGLQEAELHEMDLSFCNLSGLDFYGKDFSGSDLRGANLQGANLRIANLRRCNLSGADLRGARTTKIKLEEANLRGANLAGISLHRAWIAQADFTGANLSHVVFQVCDATGAKLHNADIHGMEVYETMWTSPYELARVDGLDEVDSGSRSFVLGYVDWVFEKAHSEYEQSSSDYLNQVLQKLQILRSIYVNGLIPDEGISVLHQVNSELVRYLKQHPRFIHELRGLDSLKNLLPNC